MTVSILFPPGTDPRAPHLALPSLAAVLRANGSDTQLIDLDIEGLLHLVSRRQVTSAGEVLRARLGPGASHEQRRLAELSDYIADSTQGALDVLHDRERFYDAIAYNHARAVLHDALAIVSEASPGVRYGIDPIRYEVQGVDVDVLRDLIDVTADQSRNLFASHWERELYSRLETHNPDIVGVSILNRQQLLPGLYLARALRARGHFVVIGGTVLSKFVDALRRRPAFFDHFADAVVVYEGETAILSLTEQMTGQRDLSQVPNLLYLDHGRVQQTRTHVENVNALPVPDFAGLPLDSYLAPRRVLPILTGKGCYFNRCKFCDIPHINSVSKKAYRVRQPETVVNDCLALKRRFDCQHFEITDEALSPKLLEQLSAALAPHAAEGFCFVGYARLEPGFTPALCKTLAATGFKKMFFGLESACQRTLDHMDKGIDVTKVPAVLKNFRDAGLSFHIFSIIGFPEEDAASARETFQFFIDNANVIDHPANSFDIHPFGLELRTRYFEDASRLGVLIAPQSLHKDFLIGLSNDSWRNSRGLSAEEADELIERYGAQLRRHFKRHHNCPGHLWPGYEEYALLYAERYSDGEFPYTTQLPELTDGRPYELIWNPLMRTEERAGRMLLCGPDGSAETSQKNYQWLQGMERETFAATARKLRDAVSEHDSTQVVDLFRRYVDELIGKGLMYVRM